MTQSPPSTTSVAIVGTAQPSPPIVAVGLDWTVLLPIIFTGLALLISTSVSAWGSIRAKQGAAATQATVEQNAAAGAAAGAVRDAKLDNITVLVNGRYSQVLQELADVKRLLAASTGTVEDHMKADAAQVRADDQAGRVTAALAVSAPLVAVATGGA
jgi:hypothetical protein